MPLKSRYVLISNIRSLLSARRLRAADLAMYCHHRPAWISKILAGERAVSPEDLDRIADFFDVDVADLFRPVSGGSNKTK